MAASTSAHSNDDYSFDVFIIHNRGPDVKTAFASHLHERLISNGLRVFLDREELQVGDDIASQIHGAIRTAQLHVAIFSPGYADSSWCLDELVLLLESWAPIIPVFYGVKPTDLRYYAVRGTDAQSLQNLERKRIPNTNTGETIQNWINALHRVAEIRGFELEAFNGDEGALLDQVVQEVLRRGNTWGWSTAAYVGGSTAAYVGRSTAAYVGGSAAAYVGGSAAAKYVEVEEFENEILCAKPYVVGLHEKVEEFKNTILCAKHQVVGIVGVGGVGKTTLAKALFHQKRVNYSKYCFLPNVREKARLGLLNSLQRQLLKSLTGTDAQMNSIGEGKEALKKHLSSCSVLMVLDDVDHLNQIDALLPVRTHLLSGSLVVITSRDKGVITSSGVENASIYHLTGLNPEYSKQLFCFYAFHQSYPHVGFEHLVDSFLEVCEGLPFFLRVFGALLNDKVDQSLWESLLDRLKQVSPSEPQEKLLISYLNLDREEQHMFLDSACFFIGRKRDTVIRIWDGAGWQGRSGFITLQHRCLLGVDDENNIEMHDHLRDFGRAIAHTSSFGRLMHYTDMLEQLSGNKQVTAVRGIRIVPGDNDLDIISDIAYEFGGRIEMKTLQLLDTENAILERLLTSPMEHFPGTLIWLRWNKCPKRSLPSWIPMRNLRVLQVSGNVLETLWEHESQAPFNLREIEINAPLSNLPSSIGQLKHLERFVVGKFVSGQVNLTKLPEEFCLLQSLTDLVLTDCSKMKSLPEFFALLSRLQHIDLSFCRNLEMLPSSFIFLSQLRHINLSDCHDLARIPDSIGHLGRLQHIDMRGCHNLERIPDSFGHLRDLQHINLSGCHDLQRLPDSFGELRYLQHIDLQGCHNLEDLPTTFGDLMNLEYINLSNCHDLERLPESFVNLSNLQHIDLSGCHNLERLPNSFRDLKKLKYLDVEGCSNLIIDRFEIIPISDNLPVAHQSQLEQLYE